MSKRRLTVLLIEDSDDDAELIARALAHGGYAVELSRVESEEALRGAVAKGEYDLAITDHELPGFDSTRVLRIVAELAPDLPCLLVSGKVGEEAVGAAMRQGALDYVSKHRLGSLPGAVERALVWSERRRERDAAEAEAQRHTARQKAITEFGEQALREENLDLLMESAVAHVAETLGAEVASILELRAGERAFLVRAEIGLEQIRAGVRVPHGSQASSQASYTMRQEQPVVVVSYEEETRFDRDPILVEGGVRSALSVEIPGHQHPFGVLGAASRTPQAFKPDDASFLNAVANILANALQRARNEEEMRELALHDSLTGLPSRTLFFDRLALALARTQRLGTRLAVLFLDIDHFKSFNDTLGHRAADRLLTQVGARIERTMRETDTVARFGGDEFVVLCEDLTDEQEAEILTSRLVSAFDTPFSFDDERHELSASIGVALSDEDNRDGETLLRDADIAMYSSKERGRATWTLATEELRDAIIDRVETKSALERAIDSDALLLHYQPIVVLDGGELCGVEALVRWDDPDGGLIQPGQFIPLAEESGLILRLGEWVLRAACGQAARWRVEFGDRAPLPIHVNFSARQVAQPDLPGLVRDVLDEAGVSPSDIALEITESALIDTQGGPMAALAELKSMGMSIVLDDFGTGYSSLSYLDRFPIDVLKIDQAFVSNLQGPTAPAPIVTAIVGVASALAVGTVAEGVETAEQTAAVAALGCEHAQGFFFARPAPAEQITRFVHDDTPLRERAAEASALAIAA